MPPYRHAGQQPGMFLGNPKELGSCFGASKGAISRASAIMCAMCNSGQRICAGRSANKRYQSPLLVDIMARERLADARTDRNGRHALVDLVVPPSRRNACAHNFRAADGNRDGMRRGPRGASGSRSNPCRARYLAAGGGQIGNVAVLRGWWINSGLPLGALFCVKLGAAEIASPDHASQPGPLPTAPHITRTNAVPTIVT